MASNFSDKFSKFIPFVLQAETVFARGHYGDYSRAVCECVKGDAGGLTKFGIDKASHPGVDIRGLTKETAEEIYFAEWQREKIEAYESPFAECFYDCCVNAGFSRACKILAMTGAEAGKFLQERAEFYKRLAAAKAKDVRFLAGWLGRIKRLKEFLKLDGSG